MDRRALIDERIRNLLTTTDMTFKQIIEQLRSENMPASFNTIRRVNRNHRFRQPRYDAKLTPQQRRELVIILKNTSKPNLSALARQFGVCHGSIWYWWDKLTKLKEKHNGIIPKDEPSLAHLWVEDIEQEFLQTGFSDDAEEFVYDKELKADGYGYNVISGHDHTFAHDADPLDLHDEGGDDDCMEHELKQSDQNLPSTFSPKQKQYRSQDEKDQIELIGPVQARNTQGIFINLPILMYASKCEYGRANSTASGCSSSTNSTPITSSGQTITTSTPSSIQQLAYLMEMNQKKESN